MKALLHKEFSLAKHPTTFLFPLLASLLVIPSYPYFVAFIYTCLGVFFIFLYGRENNDVVFTVSLPVAKRDVVRARCLMVAILECLQMVIAVPFAFLSDLLNPAVQSNIVGIEANAALFGLAFVMFGVFNIAFIPYFYKSAYKAGKALLLGGTAITVFIFAAEAAVAAVPAIHSALDTKAAEALPVQLCVLAGGMAVFALLTLLACRRGEANFEKTDL